MIVRCSERHALQVITQATLEWSNNPGLRKLLPRAGFCSIDFFVPGKHHLLCACCTERDEQGHIACCNDLHSVSLPG